MYCKDVTPPSLRVPVPPTGGGGAASLHPLQGIDGLFRRFVQASEASEPPGAGFSGSVGDDLVASVSSVHRSFDGGRWSYFHGVPKAPLRPYVTSFWELRGDFDFAVDRILPSEDVALVVNLGAPQIVLSATGERLDRDGAWIVGARTSPVTTISPPATWICGVRLTNRGSFLGLRESPRSMLDSLTDLQCVRGRGAESLPDRLHHAAGPRERFDMLGGTILSWVEGAPDWDRSVQHALMLMKRAGGLMPIAMLGEELGWSRQRLHRTFVASVGMSPKRLSRLFRFRRAVDLIGFQGGVELADIAQQAGYHDQAHFSHEFREFSAMSPGAYLKARLPDERRGFIRS